MEEEEAKILDYILSELIKKDCLRSRDLKPLDKGFLANNEDVKESVYKQYFNTLKIVNTKINIIKNKLFHIAKASFPEDTTQI